VQGKRNSGKGGRLGYWGLVALLAVGCAAPLPSAGALHGAGPPARAPSRAAGEGDRPERITPGRAVGEAARPDTRVRTADEVRSTATAPTGADGSLMAGRRGEAEVPVAAVPERDAPVAVVAERDVPVAVARTPTAMEARQALVQVAAARPAEAVAGRPAALLDAQDAEIALGAADGAPPLVSAPALATLVQHHLGDLRGVFGVAIKALDGGQGVLVNADRVFPAASLFKLPVMYEVYRQRDAGRLSLDERLVLAARFVQLDLGTLDMPVGSALSVEAALRRMITVSDNASANLLADRVGWLALNATMRDLGLQETRFTGDALTTSPRDMLWLLELVARGQSPSAASSAEMIELLLDQRVNDRLPAQLPPGTRVAHKTGNLDGVIHDVGIVYAPGAPFAIALLAEAAPDYGAVARAQAALTRAVYDYLLTVSGALPSSASPEAEEAPVTPTPTPTVPPVPTARLWRPSETLPPPVPTARLWQPATPTPTPAAATGAR
jgi:beta-lactamase class A